MFESAIVLTGVACLGAIIGSFLSVCIYRIPYGRPKGPPSIEEMNGEIEEPSVPENVQQTLSIGKPARSFCPSCNKKLYWWHNIPILSWIVLKGRCYFCSQKISIRYPLVESLSALAAVACLYKFGLSPTAFIIFAYCAALIVISFIDIEYYIIPDVISLPGIVIGILIGAANHFSQIFTAPIPPDVWGSLIGLTFGGGVLLLFSEVYIRIRKRVGLGFGDIKLLAMTGAFFGIEGAFATILFGSLFGSVIGVTLILVFRKGMTHQLPFGPYLAAGTLCYIFLSPMTIFQF